MRNDENFTEFEIPLIVVQNYLSSASGDARRNIVYGEIPQELQGAQVPTYYTQYPAFSDEVSVYVNGIRRVRQQDFEASVEIDRHLYVKFIMNIQESDEILFDYLRA